MLDCSMLKELGIKLCEILAILKLTKEPPRLTSISYQPHKNTHCKTCPAPLENDNTTVPQAKEKSQVHGHKKKKHHSLYYCISTSSKNSFKSGRCALVLLSL